jgi:hypothetical protein
LLHIATPETARILLDGEKGKSERFNGHDHLGAFGFPDQAGDFPRERERFAHGIVLYKPEDYERS